MRSVREIPVLQNIPVLVRTAMNVPIENGVVANDYRLRRSLPTIKYLSDHGAKVVLISHIGEQGTETLAPVADAFQKLIGGVTFCDVTVGEKARAAVRDLHSGGILILENLRRNKGETANDPAFAKQLAELADVFVQDSFDTCHRAHASMVTVPTLLPSYAGLLLEEEVRELTKAMQPVSPSFAVIGGAKFATKEPALESLLKVYDHVAVGGALANDFLKAAGKEVGASLVSGAPADEISAMLKNPKLVLPIDVVVVSKADVAASDARMRARTVSVDQIGKDDVVLDLGAGTGALFADHAAHAKTFLWNGPLGNYENGFTDSTNVLTKGAANSKGHTIIGGGDTIAAIENLGVLHKFSFVSTGGGAMLDLIANGTLPGIAVLDNQPQI